MQHWLTDKWIAKKPLQLSLFFKLENFLLSSSTTSIDGARLKLKYPRDFVFIKFLFAAAVSSSLAAAVEIIKFLFNWSLWKDAEGFPFLWRD